MSCDSHLGFLVRLLIVNFLHTFVTVGTYRLWASTRGPPSISGKPVTSETSRAGIRTLV
jgi:hypothetical protein